MCFPVEERSLRARASQAVCGMRTIDTVSAVGDMLFFKNKDFHLVLIVTTKACFIRRISVASNAIQTVDNEVNHLIIY